MILITPALLLALWASARVQSNFAKYAQVGVRSGMTGAEAARAVATAGGVTELKIEETQGFLSDHYDPRTRTLRLSPQVFRGRSISSIAVAAHEAGHSIQHVKAYLWLNLRSQMVPVVKFGSAAWIWIFMAGALFSSMRYLQDVGIVLFAATVLFQLVTLPVEFDASNRAKAVLASSGIVSTQEEAQGVNKVLGAAAMTYVAGALTAIMTLVYLLMRRRD
ncbi:MAG: zinc metallopeptidase [Planctomycetes bacterium]|nr:zinc metallopeptidase [Planctomycetota bacterium]